jgi:hypothetical protein
MERVTHVVLAGEGYLGDLGIGMARAASKTICACARSPPPLCATRSAAAGYVASR